DNLHLLAGRSRIVSKVLPYRVGVFEILLCRGMVDDSKNRRLLNIVLIESASSQQRYPDCLKVPGTDLVLLNSQPGAPRPPGNMDHADNLTLTDQVTTAECCRRDLRKCPDPFEQTVIERPEL